MSMDRRMAMRWIAAAPLALTVLGRYAWCAESPLMNWPSRLVRVPIDQAEHRPPVVTAVDLRPGGEQFATAGDDHQVYLWRIADGELIRRLSGHTDWVHTIAFSPVGHYLATAGNDRRVIFWDVERGESVYEFDDPRHTVTCLTWTTSGKQIAGTGFEDRLRIYDVTTRQLVKELVCPCRDMRSVDFSPDDRWLAAGGRDGVIRVWDMSEGSVSLDYRAHRRRIRGLVFSPDGDYLVSTGEDRVVHIHALEGDHEGFDLPPSRAKVLALAFYGPHHLATGGSDNVIRLWNLREMRETGVLHGHRGSIAALAANSSVLVSGSYDTTVRVWTITDHVVDDRQPAARTSRK